MKRKPDSKEVFHTQPQRPDQGGDHEPAKDDRGRREARILDAAATLLVRWGYRKTTIDDVAREAGVGKGTIYLHWKDKNELFLAAIWRASKQLTDETIRRIHDDPEGGRFYRLVAHGMTAILTNPLVSTLMRGEGDIFQGMVGALDPATIKRIYGTADDHIEQMQRAGVIRADLSIPIITFLMGAMKIGIIYMAGNFAQENMPSIEELTDAIGDMVRRWLQPADLPGNSAAGKRIMTEWLEQVNEIGTQYRSYEREDLS